MSRRYRLHHVAIQTKDFERAVHFYRNVLGLEVIKEETSPKGRRIAWIDAGQARIELYGEKPGQRLAEAWAPEGLGPLSIGFLVSDLDQAVAEIRTRGAVIHREPYFPVHNERAAMILGPDGEEIVLLEKPVGKVDFR